MQLEFNWMRPEAPYMPIVTIGLLAVLERAGLAPRARWDGALQVEVEAGVEEIANCVALAPLPDVTKVSWPTRRPQALGPSLRTVSDPLGKYRELIAHAGPNEQMLLRGLATDQALDEQQAPLRTRLLRGAKSDLSAFGELTPVSAAEIAAELTVGPQFTAGKSGLALGLVPEVQTFGGTVGPDASEVGAASPLLSVLLRHGILALPPIGVRRGSRWVAGGPLIDGDLSLSWPQWSIPCGARELRAAFAWRSVQEASPDFRELAHRGISAVFRSAGHKLSTTVVVFRWGERVA